MKSVALAFIVAALSLAPRLAHAQDGGNTIGLGAALVPDYDGSSSYVVRPSLTGRLSFGGIGVDLRGTGLRADVLPGRIAAGPVFNYRFGRSDDVENAQVAALAPIDGAFEIGAFVSVPLDERFAITAEVLGDVSGAHSGLLATLSADWRQAVTDRFRVFASASVTAMDDSFAQTYYGVTAAGSAASGLPVYTPGGGIRSAGLTLGGSFDITPRASVTATVGYQELMGSAADSPVVQVGSTGQVVATLGLGWRF